MPQIEHSIFFSGRRPRKLIQRHLRPTTSKTTKRGALFHRAAKIRKRKRQKKMGTTGKQIKLQIYENYRG